jgi:hypothetical protein
MYMFLNPTTRHQHFKGVYGSSRQAGLRVLGMPPRRLDNRMAFVEERSSAFALFHVCIFVASNR